MVNATKWLPLLKKIYDRNTNVYRCSNVLVSFALRLVAFMDFPPHTILEVKATGNNNKQHYYLESPFGFRRV